MHMCFNHNREVLSSLFLVKASPQRSKRLRNILFVFKTHVFKCSGNVLLVKPNIAYLAPCFVVVFLQVQWMTQVPYVSV